MENKNRSMRKGFEHMMKSGHQRIIFGALKQLHVRPFREEFEDFLQEARLTYAKAYVSFPGDPVLEDEKFRVYAYQAVYWRTLDLIRVSQKVEENNLEEFTKEELTIPTLICNPKLVERMMSDELFRRLYEKCTPAERRFLTDSYVSQLSNAEIAQKENISRQRVSRLRRQVGCKALMVIENSED